MNITLKKFAHGATHYCKFKHTALCENAFYYDNKTTINKPILCRFRKICFQRSQNWNTPFYLQMFCALSGRLLSWNTPVFSRFTSRQHANFIGCHCFHTRVLPHHSKSQLLRYCGKRSFLGAVKSWKVTLDRVPWFGRHVENLVTSSYIQFWLWPGHTLRHSKNTLRPLTYELFFFKIT